jgi:hypothetical protein
MFNKDCTSNEVFKDKYFCKRRRINGEKDEDIPNLEMSSTFCTDLTQDCFVTPSPPSRLSERGSTSDQHRSFDGNHELISDYLSNIDDAAFSENDEEHQWREDPNCFRNTTKLNDAFERHLVATVGNELMSCLEQTRTVALTIMDSLETQLLTQRLGNNTSWNGEQANRAQGITMNLVEAQSVFSRGSACVSRSLTRLAMARSS